ncbi:MAG: OmpA family protein [Rhodobacteraceae bacterium]|nr:OmpA family protein [Paracoccaceae bacterium]
MQPSRNLIMALAFALAALLCFLGATWAAIVVESRSATAVRSALAEAGLGWAEVRADGLQVILSGEAPTEPLRFRAISVAGQVVDGARVVDAMEVAAGTADTGPAFAVEILRNDGGITLIGLVPERTDRAALVDSLSDIAPSGSVTDLLGTAAYDPPPGFTEALSFALASLRSLPRSKISVTPGQVSIRAIADSPAAKARLESELNRKVGANVRLVTDISAPRPVIAPFTLRFQIDAQGARFDACSADTEAARDRIVAAARAAGAQDPVPCTIGLGVPSPAWADAVTMALSALAGIGQGTVTFTDGDVSLVVPDDVDAARFDTAVGTLESNLPEVFSLKAVREARAEDPGGGQAVPEFSAVLGADGNVQLKGRITDERLRDAVTSFARARFGKDAVFPAMRVDAGLPEGWPLRVLTGIEALGELNSGSVVVTADLVRIEGVSGSKDARATVTRILTDKLGGTGRFAISVSYDEALDPLASLPTPEECVNALNAILAERKIAFEPGSATIAPEAKDTIDRLAQQMKECSDVPMEVGGHTDSQGRDEMNEQLSRDRAQAVITAISDRRVLTGNLEPRGYGETVPIGDNATEAGREMNRRIEFRLLRPADPAPGSADAAAAAAAAVEVRAPDDGTIRPRPRPAKDGG